MDSTYFTHKLAAIITANPNLPITYILEGREVSPKGITYSPSGITINFTKDSPNGNNKR